MKPITKPINALTLAIGASILAAGSIHAQVIVSDNFGSSTVPGPLLDDNSGSGWTAEWSDKNNFSTISSGSLGYTDGSGNILNTTGGNTLNANAVYSSTSSSEGQRLLPSTLGTMGANNTAAAGTVWMSYLWSYNGSYTSSGLNSSGLLRQAGLMLLAGGTSSGTPPVTGNGTGTEYLDLGMPNISTVGGSVSPNFSLWGGGHGLLSSTPNSTAPNQSTLGITTGQTYFVLVEFQLDNVNTTADTINVWVDPTLGATPGTPTLTFSSQDLSSINEIRFQSGGYNVTYGGAAEQSAGDITFGDTMSDVESFTPGAVPEPGTMALAGLGGLGLLALKRKR